MATSLQARNPDSLNVGVNTSIRALHVVNDTVLWFGGNKGWLGRSTDGGQSWKRWQPAGEQADFRTLHAIDELNAIAATTTRPANIIRTHDGGKTWKRVFQSRDTSVFLDGMAFWNETDGVLFGDPINDRLFLMRTNDGGHSWMPFHYVEQPQFQPGEACFAASGTSIRAVGDSTLVIVSGGTISRLWYSFDRGHSWQNTKTPMLQGEASQGAFGVSLAPDSHLVIVGGDYLKERDTIGHIANYYDNFWWKNRSTTRGYRECILTNDTLDWITTGPSGTDISYNGGLDWHPLNNFRGMHSVQQAKNGKTIYLAGSGGVVWRYAEMPKPDYSDWMPKTEYGKALQTGDIKPLEKKIKRIVRKYGKAQNNKGEPDYRPAANKIALKIKQLEGVDSVYTTERVNLSFYYKDGMNFGPPIIVHLRLQTGVYNAQYCLELEKGGIYNPGLRPLSNWTRKLKNPRLYSCSDFEREQHIVRQRLAAQWELRRSKF